MDALIVRRGGTSAPATEGWVRPSDWLTLPTVADGDEKFVGLHAIFPDSNFVAFTVAGAYTVDWGDGTSNTYSSGATAEHEYNYSTYDTGNTTLCSRGYKQAIITITPQVGNSITSINLSVRHSALSVIYASGFLDMALGGPSLSDLQIGLNVSAGTSLVRWPLVEQVALYQNSLTTVYQLFSNFYNLQSVKYLYTNNVTTTAYLFNSCFRLTTVPLFNTSSVTDMTNMFRYCYALKTVPLFNTSAVTNMSSMFSGCFSLQTVPLFNTSAVTTMSGMFLQCFSLQTVPALSGSGATSSSTYSIIFSNCSSLSDINITDFKYTFSVASCKLSADRLNEIYTNLPTVTGQTLTVTGNYGTASDDPSIATAKGWTVTG